MTHPLKIATAGVIIVLIVAILVARFAVIDPKKWGVFWIGVAAVCFLVAFWCVVIDYAIQLVWSFL